MLYAGSSRSMPLSAPHAALASWPASGGLTAWGEESRRVGGAWGEEESWGKGVAAGGVTGSEKSHGCACAWEVRGRADTLNLGRWIWTSNERE